MLASRTLMRARGRATQASQTRITVNKRTCATKPKVKTAILMLNLGGPKTQDEVNPFLTRLFQDPEIIGLPFLQKQMGAWIANNRTPKVKEQYASIGGGSPILKWTTAQGEAMVEKLDKLSPDTAPHKFYVGFRYAQPLTDETLKQMKEDNVKRVVGFTQYPQFSCTTTGSSVNELYRQLKALDMTSTFDWSLIDRWPVYPKLIQSFAHLVREGLQQFDEGIRDKVTILFSAHSIPMKVVDRGDPYIQEVCGTVQQVMETIGYSNPYRLAWQSKVGPLPWMGPQTEKVLNDYGEKKHTKNILIVPIVFTSDHIETLFELDQEYIPMAKKLGLNVKRAKALNDEPLFTDALASLVKEHLDSKTQTTNQFKLRCPGCVNPYCGQAKSYFSGSQCKQGGAKEQTAE